MSGIQLSASTTRDGQSCLTKVLKRLDCRRGLGEAHDLVVLAVPLAELAFERGQGIRFIVDRDQKWLGPCSSPGS